MNLCPHTTYPNKPQTPQDTAYMIATLTNYQLHHLSACATNAPLRRGFAGALATRQRAKKANGTTVSKGGDRRGR